MCLKTAPMVFQTGVWSALNRHVVRSRLLILHVMGVCASRLNQVGVGWVHTYIPLPIMALIKFCHRLFGASKGTCKWCCQGSMAWPLRPEGREYELPQLSFPVTRHFACLIRTDYEDILTVKISRFTVH